MIIIIVSLFYFNQNKIIFLFLYVFSFAPAIAICASYRAFPPLLHIMRHLLSLAGAGFQKVAFLDYIYILYQICGLLELDVFITQIHLKYIK